MLVVTTSSNLEESESNASRVCRSCSKGPFINLVDIEKFIKKKDGGSPDARLRLNDGAKLWVSFKLYFKTNNFFAHIGEIYYKGLDIPSYIPLIT